MKNADSSCPNYVSTLVYIEFLLRYAWGNVDILDNQQAHDRAQ